MTADVRASEISILYSVGVVRGMKGCFYNGEFYIKQFNQCLHQLIIKPS